MSTKHGSRSIGTGPTTTWIAEAQQPESELPPWQTIATQQDDVIQPIHCQRCRSHAASSAIFAPLSRSGSEQKLDLYRAFGSS